MKISVQITLALIICLLSACGQKGALVRPDHRPTTVITRTSMPEKFAP
jgi:hypothetical protein